MDQPEGAALALEPAGSKALPTSFVELTFFEDVETTDSEQEEGDHHHFEAPPVTPELLATLLKQVRKRAHPCTRTHPESRFHPPPHFTAASGGVLFLRCEPAHRQEAAQAHPEGRARLRWVRTPCGNRQFAMHAASCLSFMRTTSYNPDGMPMPAAWIPFYQ